METALDPCHIQTVAKNPKRPRDLNQRAKHIVDIATGEKERPVEPEGKKPAKPCPEKEVGSASD